MTIVTHHQDVVWIGALAAAPVALLVAGMCRGMTRPATRHAMWCLVLLTFVVPGVLVATGTTGVIGDALLGVPRALAWAFPPERAGAAGEQGSDPSVAGPDAGGESDVSFPERPAPRAGTGGGVPAAALPGAMGAEGDRSIAGGEAALADPLLPNTGGERGLPADRQHLAVGAAPRTGATSARPAPEVQIQAGSSRGVELPPAGRAAPPVGLTAPRSDAKPTGSHGFETAEARGRKALGSLEPTGSRGTVLSRPVAALLSPMRAIGEPERAASQLASGLTDRLLASAIGVGRGGFEVGGPEGMAREADAGEGRAGAGRASEPSRPNRLAPDPTPVGTAAVVDPVWNALESAAMGIRSWLASVRAAAESVLRIPAPPAALWFAGAMVIIALGGARTLAARAAIRRMQPVDRTDRRLMEDLAERLGLRTTPRAYLVRKRISPMVCGGLNPKIILPEALWRTLDLDARRAVLTHELAHLRRRDQWVRLLELGIGVLYWWHPVLWAVRRRIREEADLCCDAWVTTLFPGLRRRYAEALLRTRCYLSMPGAAAPVAGLGMASARSRRFSRRLTMVMTGQTRPKTSPLGLTLALAVGTAALVVVPSLAHATLAKKTSSCPPETAAVVVTAPGGGGGSATITSRPARLSGPTNPLGVSSGGGVGRVTTAGPSRASAGVISSPPRADAAAPQAQTGSCCGATPSAASAPSGFVLGGPTGIRSATGGSLVRGAPMPGGGSPAITGVTRAAGVVPGAEGAGLDARVRALEARIDALDASIQRLLHRLESGDSGARSPSSGRAPTAFQSLNAMPQFELASSDDGEESWVGYSLPEGKLDALWELMARSDVPIYVRMQNGSIELEGTAAQQRVFAQFLALIHPDGAEEWASGSFGDAGAVWAPGAFAEDAARAGRRAETTAREVALLARERELQTRAAALQAELSARLGTNREVMAESRRQLSTELERRRVEANGLMRRAEQAETEARRARDRAAAARTDAQREALEAEADALHERADGWREGADALREALDEMRAELDRAMAQMEVEAVDARDEIQAALAEARAELARARADMRAARGGGEQAENCACHDGCTGGDCADDCDDDCHCRAAGAAAPAAPADPARPARPGAPRPQRD